MQIIGQTWLYLGSWSEGQHDLYFTGQWFCLISWRLFDVYTSYFGSMNLYDSMFDLKINVGHWPIFHGPVILPYILNTIWCMNILIWDYESVWPDIWPQNKCRSLWHIFHGPVILHYILKTAWCMNIIILDYGCMSVIFSDNETVWPKVNISQHDLYFMV